MLVCELFRTLSGQNILRYFTKFFTIRKSINSNTKVHPTLFNGLADYSKDGEY
jgi:hypothetical protein